MKKSASDSKAGTGGLGKQGGRVGGPNDPMIDARTRLIKQLEAEGKTLEDVAGEGKGTAEQVEANIKVQ